jgi:hypothetical protein
MTQSKVFQRVRAGRALAVLAATGCAAALAACTSSDNTYRPAPNYRTAPANPVYQSPSATYPQTTPPPPTPTPAPKPATGGGACGGGKCG